ncbi:pyridoxal-dependent decarboxylase, exosortase A system-associated [Rhodospirillum rubrum]|uniref:pyridoxal-dependent decarboxylase, exosortase A system-associated n=1 Tax=Rhodospirillum rubrum TaxID=1085 RepID=UPI00190622E7|nr:pyridoxal-dependent decarboxylase, exosortase A system-associated [Rhodospirillum rubrum]MBK1665174.1 pyridoxal-dependent decarboxylase, exosortase A system-associated [Rhodospirillum rubrum]MBK1678338.1 pyridoxal-dependent decarboxylase, exosortase A system-associated [Rhodospirillum rubrum]
MTASPPPGFGVIGNELTIGGQRVSQLARIAGGTPFYAYDRGAVSARIAALRAALPAGVALRYSLKANPMAALLAHMAPLVDGFDAASASELRAGLAAGMAPAALSIAGPGKSPADILSAVAAGALVVVESLAEVGRVAQAGNASGLRPRVLVRVNPEAEIQGAGLRMGGGARPFGIDADQVPGVLAAIAAHDLDYQGLHCFWGSQALDAERIARAFAVVGQTLLGLASPRPPRQIIIGGGFGIPYTPTSAPLDLARAGAAVAETAGLLGDHLPGVSLGLELGRFLVGEAGVYVCAIRESKRSRGNLFLVTDGGLHHNQAATGNFGQVVRRPYPLVIATRMGEPVSERATITGCLCTPLDVFAEALAIPAAAEGDLVAIFQSGAYGASASPSAFLGHPPAVELLV